MTITPSNLWNPDQYLKFAGPRLRPALDLLAAIQHPDPKVIYDLGCGAGNVTRFLMERWPGATLTGIDNSPSMLEKARAEHPDLVWAEGDLSTWRAETPADVLYSNAALHWLLPDHEGLFKRLLTCLAPGGVLAVQMPRNIEAPSHQLIYDVAKSGPWADKLAVPIAQERRVPAPEFYYDLLTPLAATVDIWQTTYTQVLDGDNPVAEYTKGSVLKAFLDHLTDATDQRAFFETYSEQVQAVYPKRADGKTLFPFTRLFLVVTARR